MCGLARVCASACVRVCAGGYANVRLRPRALLPRGDDQLVLRAVRGREVRSLRHIRAIVSIAAAVEDAVISFVAAVEDAVLGIDTTNVG